MIDVVTIIETKAESLGYKFDYGKRDWHNLLRSDLEIGKVYFMLDPLRITPNKTKFGAIVDITVKSQFLIAVKSDLDNVIHQQKEQDKATGKYLTNIRPLFEEVEKFVNTFNCDESSIVIDEIADIYNYLDVNLDGLVVTFTFKE